jgi:hypothetical protein
MDLSPTHGHYKCGSPNPTNINGGVDADIEGAVDIEISAHIFRTPPRPRSPFEPVIEKEPNIIAYHEIIQDMDIPMGSPPILSLSSHFQEDSPSTAQGERCHNNFKFRTPPIAPSPPPPLEILNEMNADNSTPQVAQGMDVRMRRPFRAPASFGAISQPLLLNLGEEKQAPKRRGGGYKLKPRLWRRSSRRGMGSNPPNNYPPPRGNLGPRFLNVPSFPSFGNQEGASTNLPQQIHRNVLAPQPAQAGQVDRQQQGQLGPIPSLSPSAEDMIAHRNLVSRAISWSPSIFSAFESIEQSRSF